jgi:hypothetical protein
MCGERKERSGRGREKEQFRLFRLFRLFQSYAYKTETTVHSRYLDLDFEERTTPVRKRCDTATCSLKLSVFFFCHTHTPTHTFSLSFTHAHTYLHVSKSPKETFQCHSNQQKRKESSSFWLFRTALTLSVSLLPTLSPMRITLDVITRWNAYPP